jgi:hypothetical protein
VEGEAFAEPDFSGMRSQFATASKRNLRFLPFIFTEHGAIMATESKVAPKNRRNRAARLRDENPGVKKPRRPST